MKTLLFATCHSNSYSTWIERYKKYLDFYSDSRWINYDQIILVDDGSSTFPSLSDVTIFNELSERCTKYEKIMYHFRENLGRPHSLDYPGWFRSFTFGAIWAKRFSFDKVVHIESDTYILSRKLTDYINSLESGWNTLWCPRSSFPETCIQVICKDQLDSFFELSQMDYRHNFYGVEKNECIETMLWRGPLKRFTNVCKDFVGDRYSEDDNNVPEGADYVCQAPSNWIPIKY